MSELYSIERSNDYLEHYGVKGMKWKNHVYAVKDQVQQQLQGGGATQTPQQPRMIPGGTATGRPRESHPIVTIDTDKAKQKYKEGKRKAKMWAIRKTAKATMNSAKRHITRGEFRKAGKSISRGYKVTRGLIRI